MNQDGFPDFSSPRGGMSSRDVRDKCEWQEVLGIIPEDGGYHSWRGLCVDYRAVAFTSSNRSVTFLHMTATLRVHVTYIHELDEIMYQNHLPKVQMRGVMLSPFQTAQTSFDRYLYSSISSSAGSTLMESSSTRAGRERVWEVIWSFGSLPLPTGTPPPLS